MIIKKLNYLLRSMKQNTLIVKLYISEKCIRIFVKSRLGESSATEYLGHALLLFVFDFR